MPTPRLNRVQLLVPLVLAAVLAIASLALAASAGAASSGGSDAIHAARPAPHYPTCRFHADAAINAPCTTGGLLHFVAAGSTGYTLIGVRTIVGAKGPVKVVRFRERLAVQHASFLERPGEPEVTRYYVLLPLNAYPPAGKTLLVEQWAVLDRAGHVLARKTLSSPRVAEQVRIKHVAGGVLITGNLPRVGRPGAPKLDQPYDESVRSPDRENYTTWGSTLGRGFRFAFRLRANQFRDGHVHLLQLEAPVRVDVAKLVVEHGRVRVKMGTVLLGRAGPDVAVAREDGSLLALSRPTPIFG